jgi:hypothetical protein
MSRSPVDAVAGRIDRLERESRRWKWRSGLALVAGLAGAAASVVALVARPADRSGVIEAGQIVLRDKHGKMRATLAVRPDGSPVLALYDDREGNQLLVGLGPDGAVGFDAFQRDGKDRLTLGLWADGTAGLNLFDKGGTKRVTVAVQPDGTPTVLLRDGTGKPLDPQP